MIPGILFPLIVTQVEATSGQHRFLWIPMSETVFWFVTAAVTIGLGFLAAALVRVLRRHVKPK